MTKINPCTQQYGFWIHDLPSTEQKVELARFYTDTAWRQRPAKIARELLNGNILHRFPDIFPVTGQAGSLRICSILFYIKGIYEPQKIDALGALLVRDRLVRLRRWQERKGNPTAKTDEALSFCKGVLGLLKQHDAESFRFVTDQLYPFESAPKKDVRRTTRGRYFYKTSPEKRPSP